jgi:hypothetical protein
MLSANIPDAVSGQKYLEDYVNHEVEGEGGKQEGTKD